MHPLIRGFHISSIPTGETCYSPQIRFQVSSEIVRPENQQIATSQCTLNLGTCSSPFILYWADVFPLLKNK